MSFGRRLGWAAVIVLADLVVFVAPLAALFAGYVLLARPPWFRDWMLQVYRD